ncbi:MAG: phosphoribosylformylglycinamidine cyclo-ligase [Oscillospiraceae bacterium]|nr:phosphoribosylformylglycinamidine cyclo-ligase [Oscillospiraceae bacterium]
MEANGSETYKSAGVDVTAGYKAVELMKVHAAKTYTPGVIRGLGGFGSLFKLDISGKSEPVLVSGTDGVGTKLKLAFIMDRHNTVGIDCVAMCANDIVCVGAAPLYFIDYIACGKNDPEKIAGIVEGISAGCISAGCALIGGETAEHPGMMPENEYDLAGFCTGIADKKDIIDGSAHKPGDVLIALASSGVHSNGFSLIRKIFDLDKTCDKYYSELNAALGEELLTPTKIYVKAILGLMEKVRVLSVSHITGGGLYENIPRSLPDGLGVVIKEETISVPPIFDIIIKEGGLDRKEMYGVFNMGVGMAVGVRAQDVDATLECLQKFEIDAYVLGILEARNIKCEVV